MSEDISHIVSDAEDHMKKAITHLETELTKIRAGKANPQILDGIVVDYYGSPTPISQVGNISVMDVRTLSIQPGKKTCFNLLKEQS
jgi:ribosome recycling factor